VIFNSTMYKLAVSTPLLAMMNERLVVQRQLPKADVFERNVVSLGLPVCGFSQDVSKQTLQRADVLA